MPGTELLFNPLFPLLIAAASFVTHDYEWAARLVSLLLGALLPLPVFGIASRLFNRRIGLVAALLTVLHPLLVNLSFTTYSEGPYMTLLLSAVYVVVRASESLIDRGVVVGGCCIRARVPPSSGSCRAISNCGGVRIYCHEGRHRRQVQTSGGCNWDLLVLTSPEVILIYRSTGKVMLEGKSTLFFDLGTRILSAEKSLEVHRQLPDGQEPYPPAPTAVWGREGLIIESAAYNWAHFAVDTHLRGTGTAMRTNAEVIRETR